MMNSLIIVDSKLNRPQKEVFYTKSHEIRVNGSVTQNTLSTYIGKTGDNFSATISIIDSNGDLVTELDQPDLGYPPVLALPLTKIIGSSTQIVDEVYHASSLNRGVLTISGKFASSGNWVLNKDRINKALDAIDSSWHIHVKDVNFLIVENVE